jgi:enoyl-CoA hydratase
MSDELVLFERRGAVALLTINRPQTMNALDMAMLDALEAAVDRAAGDKEVRVLVLTGAGKAFVAGGDIAELNSRNGLRHYFEFGERIHAVFRKIEALDKPTVGAINGWALGGGTELLLCLDIRIVAEGAKLGLPEVTLGMFPGAGGSQRLIRQLAPCKAKELMFTGDRITAAEALSLGLVNRVVPDTEVLDAAMTLAERIAKFSPVTLTIMKRVIDDGAQMPLTAALHHEQAMIGLLLDSKDAHEGCTAFLEKRQANFTGE